jgi:hypothetical protein
MSANGTHPYYVLGKGLFYRASDLYALGGFNPWITIEDPEVGMRLWTNGRRLGIIAAPLIEEVPRTFYRGIIQRNRWVCGFFQSLASPLKRMGMPFWRRMQARINIIPVLSHPINVIGLPTGVYADDDDVLSECLAAHEIGTESDAFARPVHASDQSDHGVFLRTLMGGSAFHRLCDVSRRPRQSVGAHPQIRCRSSVCGKVSGLVEARDLS